MMTSTATTTTACTASNPTVAGLGEGARVINYWTESGLPEETTPDLSSIGNKNIILADAFQQLQGMSLEAIADRYVELNAGADRTLVKDLLRGRLIEGRIALRFGGSDNFLTNCGMLTIETNSCPSGGKAQPVPLGGWKSFRDTPHGKIFEYTLEERVANRAGALIVLADKNEKGVSQYAQVMAGMTDSTVYIIPCHDNDAWKHFFSNGYSTLNLPDRAEPVPVAGIFRYTTEDPFNRIPQQAQTDVPITNDIMACIGGGRDKLAAAKAYDEFNEKYASRGINILIPQTSKYDDLEAALTGAKSFGRHFVVKFANGHAGVGTYTVDSAVADWEDEVRTTYAAAGGKGSVIVQQLIGSKDLTPDLYVLGSAPDANGNAFAFDLRFGVAVNEQAGFTPTFGYARRARKPLQQLITDTANLRDYLGTNLSEFLSEDDGVKEWGTAEERRLHMSNADLAYLGLTLDHLIEAFVKTCATVTAINNFANKLVVPETGKLDLVKYTNLVNNELVLSSLAELEEHLALSTLTLSPASSLSSLSSLSSSINNMFEAAELSDADMVATAPAVTTVPLPSIVPLTTPTLIITPSS